MKIYQALKMRALTGYSIMHSELAYMARRKCCLINVMVAVTYSLDHSSPLRYFTSMGSQAFYAFLQ